MDARGPPRARSHKAILRLVQIWKPLIQGGLCARDGTTDPFPQGIPPAPKNLALRVSVLFSTSAHLGVHLGLQQAIILDHYLKAGSELD